MTEGLIGVIGGTGFGDELLGHLSGFEKQNVDTPFGKCSDSILIGNMGPNKIAFINRHGAGHKLSPSEVPFAANVFALKSLGAKVLISTGAVGSLQEKNAPGDLVIVDQFIDKTFKRQSTFFEDYGAVHCEFAHPTCSRLSDIIQEAAQSAGIKSHQGGTYVCMEGPQFSSRAESLMHRSWGGDLIGMTALPEAKLAREAQMCSAMVALVSDYDCWREHEAGKDKQTLLQEIISNLKTATDNCIKLITAVLEGSNSLLCEDCHCRKSLELAVWTEPKKINAAKKEQLKALFE
ncbi:MAG: MTAP family purine nucleoside phosphorylase [Phycisphaerales bacterium]|jgi:5'-methylthioadenosine phosphorylase